MNDEKQELLPKEQHVEITVPRQLNIDWESGDKRSVSWFCGIHREIVGHYTHMREEINESYRRHLSAGTGEKWHSPAKLPPAEMQAKSRKFREYINAAKRQIESHNPAETQGRFSFAGSSKSGTGRFLGIVYLGVILWSVGFYAYHGTDSDWGLSLLITGGLIYFGGLGKQFYDTGLDDYVTPENASIILENLQNAEQELWKLDGSHERRQQLLSNAPQTLWPQISTSRLSSRTRFITNPGGDNDDRSVQLLSTATV